MRDRWHTGNCGRAGQGRTFSSAFFFKSELPSPIIVIIASSSASFRAPWIFRASSCSWTAAIILTMVARRAATSDFLTGFFDGKTVLENWAACSASAAVCERPRVG